ncbi:hypothetical protein K438DRAFT_1996399 [Mycena galopus ATCC 62051]|nr:hypothetical protein K438DRAFT_1996399 [Mycena galopus ATCC 62051]
MSPKFAAIFRKVRRLFRIRATRVEPMVEPELSTIPSSLPPCLFLGLPCELRLQIYDAVVSLPLGDCQVARQSRKPIKPPARATPARLPISWLSLMLLEVDNLGSRYGIADKVTWHQIPCPPSGVRTLEAELVLNLMTRLWGCGGPNPILSQLYQVLNCFIHNGPLLVKGSPLLQHIHLETLSLRIRVLDVDPDGEGRTEPYSKKTVDYLKKDIRRDLQRYISEVVERGLLFGAVEKIVMRSADDSEGDLTVDDGGDNATADDADDDDGCGNATGVTEWEVRYQRIGDMTEWNAYNFHWGVPGSSSLPKPEQSGALGGN